MARRNLSAVVRYLQRLTGSASASGASDAELLERYVRHRDETAFELLLWRHGVLVFNVCRRILPREQDAEDAFQATFLAFVRKAGSISRRGSVAAWLYKVAYRVALEAREQMRKTAAVEKRGGETLAVQPASDPFWSEVRPILDEEVNRLPERLRRPFVLCYLEGKSNEEAARELGCRLGTIYSRLARGREMLRRRLLRRGVTLSVAGLTARAAEAMPAIPLMRTTVQAALSFADPSATAAVSPRVATLVEGVLRTMFVTKLKIAAAMLFVASVLAAGGVLSRGLTAAPQAETKAEEPPPKPEGGDKKDAEAIPVKVVKPTPGGLARTVKCRARVIASQQQQLVPLISGTIEEVGVDIGDRVKKGQTLIVFDAPLIRKEVEQAAAALEMAEAQAEEAEAQVVTAQADVKSAKAALIKAKADKTFAQAKLKSAEELVSPLEKQWKSGQIPIERFLEARGGVTAAQGQVQLAEAEIANAEADVQVKMGKLAHARAALKRAKANVRSSQATVDKARIEEGFTRITAAFDGVVTRRTAQPGNFVQASDSRLLTPLITLQRTDRLRIAVEVPARDAPFVSLGDPVDLTLDDLPGLRITGQKIARFSPVLDGSNRMTVEIDVSDPDGRLMPGMNGKTTIHFKKRLANALVVPLSCLANYGGPQPTWVYIVRDGKAHLTNVIVTAEDGKNAEIVGDVKASDLIVTDLSKMVGEVVPVKIEQAP